MKREPVSFVVDQSVPGERLDRYLGKRFSEISRGTIRRLIESGFIRVNGRHATPTQAPRRGDQVEIHWPEPEPAEATPEDLPLDILFEDDDLLVLNKEAGQVVHPSAGHTSGTLVHALLHHCSGSLSGIGGVARPGIVHRLDRETSGCLIVAKHDQAHLALAAQFADRTLEKVYQVVVCGRMTVESGDIRAAIARHPNHRKRMAVTTGGREAWTTFRTLEILDSATWVEATLHTGRTHQIRVHFHHLGHPVLGDAIYGRRINARVAQETGYQAPRQLLHAWRIKFQHPVRGEAMSFEAPLPADFREALKTLGSKAGR